ncbi:MAG: asparagine synthetase B family protein [Moorellales bacterium]
MCGIAGWIDRKLDLTTQRPVIEAMTQTLANRRPDASGLWLSPRAAIGHRRLIVIDPRGGGQPMVKHLGPRRYLLTYNGELYNAAELRRELEARGHRFFGYSDTEVVLTAFMEWGPECLARFNGMFAFGLWDEADETLYLARDPLGIKPLFWVETDGGLLFASEIKALLAHPALPAAR